MTRSQRSSYAVLFVVLMLLSAGCGGVAGRTTRSGVVTTPVTLEVAPWVDQPVGSSQFLALLPKPLPPTPPQTGAPRCLPSNLSASSRALGISMDDGVVIGLRNTGRAACLLRGTPRVVAVEPGRPDVVATADPMPSYGEVADTPPDGISELQVDVPAACSTDGGGSNRGFPIYQTLIIEMPGGGTKVVRGLLLTFQCGISNTPFWSAQPPPTYPPEPLVYLAVHLQLLPVTVHAGSTLDYQVDLVNPGARSVPLSPCPVYEEWSTIPTKFASRLNCSTIHAIAARGEVRYQMEMAIPVGAASGPAKIWWSLFGVGTYIARATFQVG